jgi:hypothetical protein
LLATIFQLISCTTTGCIAVSWGDAFPTTGWTLPEMPVFEICPTSLPNGDFAATWFDDENCLWEDPRLFKAISLHIGWNTPALQLHRPNLGATAVLFNPNACAVSQGVKDELARFPELEFLPVRIEHHGTFFVFNVVASCELPAGSKARIPGAPGYNIVDIQAFPASFEPSMAFFRVRQPPDSAAGRAGSCVRSIYANSQGASAIATLVGAYLSAIEIPSA